MTNIPGGPSVCIPARNSPRFATQFLRRRECKVAIPPGDTRPASWWSPAEIAGRKFWTGPIWPRVDSPYITRNLSRGCVQAGSRDHVGILRPGLELKSLKSSLLRVRELCAHRARTLIKRRRARWLDGTLAYKFRAAINPREDARYDGTIRGQMSE